MDKKDNKYFNALYSILSSYTIFAFLLCFIILFIEDYIKMGCGII